MHPFEDLIVPEKSVGIHWFGQNSFGLKLPGGAIFQVDPYFPHDRPAGQFIHARPPLDEATLRTDFVLLTHNHGDHTCVESVRRICAAQADVRIVGPVESAAELTEAGVPEHCLAIVAAGETISLGDVTVHAVWAKPPDGVPEDDIAAPDVRHLGYVVDTGDVRVYDSGDLINTFANHESLLAPIRELAPDIGFLTTHPTEGEFPFFEGSARMTVELGLDAAVPAHYGCFVKRTYDPREWASHLPPGGPKPLIVPYNQSVVYSPE